MFPGLVSCGRPTVLIPQEKAHCVFLLAEQKSIIVGMNLIRNHLSYALISQILIN